MEQRFQLEEVFLSTKFYDNQFGSKDCMECIFLSQGFIQKVGTWIKLKWVRLLKAAVKTATGFTEER